MPKQKTQTEVIAHYMRELDLNPKEMADLMAIPYYSFRDLRSARRKLRPIHVRLLDMAVVCKENGLEEDIGWPDPQDWGRWPDAAA